MEVVHTGVPLVPVVIHDSERLVTRRPPVVRPGTITLDVLEARHPSEGTRASLDAIARDTTAAMQTALDARAGVIDLTR